jgi:hypothetical protein
LHAAGVIAIVPAHLVSIRTDARAEQPVPVTGRWVRVGLLVVALGLIGVFILAGSLDPYGKDGSPLRLETHRQLGFPRCTFYHWAGVPCPSCGMTTSFALLVRGDVAASLRANLAGTLLGVACLFYIPWSLTCILRRRLFLVRSLERTVTVFLTIFLAVMLIRWGLVLWLGWEI